MPFFFGKVCISGAAVKSRFFCVRKSLTDSEKKNFLKKVAKRFGMMLHYTYLCNVLQ